MLYILHCGLRKVWRALESHWDSSIFIHSKWYAFCAQVLTFVVKLEGIVYHADIQLAEKCVPCAFAKDISYDWQRVLLILDNFIKLSEVAYPANSFILFR